MGTPLTGRSIPGAGTPLNRQKLKQLVLAFGRGNSKRLASYAARDAIEYMTARLIASLA
jgi:hypothetical protein